MKKSLSLITLILLFFFISCSKDEVVNTPPVINTQSFSVAEDVNDTHVIGEVQATDANEDTLTFSIKTDASNLFEITTNGALSLKENSVLDYETTNAYELSIEVSDGTNSVSTTITINVTDVDENTAPVIDAQTFTAAEDITDTTEIGAVIANDAEGNTLSFSIVSDTVLFEITTDGKLSLASGKSLDYETTTSYTIGVQVSDGSLTASNTITINVTDVDENSTPVINAQTFTVAEDINDTVEIGTVIATDAESDALSFSIPLTDSGIAPLFEITTDGKLSLISGRRLDYESTTSHTIRVQVSDGNSTADNIITINVTDVDETIGTEADLFITTWEVTTSNLSITIPIHNALTYDYNIDWGDGVIERNVTADSSHTYTTPGVYTVKISGDFPHLYLFKTRPQFARGARSNSNNGKLASVEQWGAIQWASFYGMFHSAENLEINATDTPNLTNVQSMERAFVNATNFNSDISNWDVSNVTNMSAMFQNASSFNQDISGWNISKVTTMASMFRWASSFNQDISGWDTSKVTSMDAMFNYATSFNQNLGTWSLESIQGASSNNLTFMLADSGMSSINYGETLKGWAENPNTPNNLTLTSVRGIKFCQSFSSYRNKLINDKGWSIVGDTSDQGC